MPTLTDALPTPTEQADRIIDTGLHDMAGLPVDALRRAAADAPEGALLVIHPKLLPPSVLTPAVIWRDRPAFVVADMTDVDDFDPVDDLPDAPAYAVTGLDRGDAMANWSPDEALPALVAAGRTPLTVTEGLFWVLQQPGALERGYCFMTIGSRRRKPGGALDTRTPALWISNGTGRDGRARRDALKVGWCWAGNRHTWLGFASAARRQEI
ncbi:hypothetical protein A5757_03955 [Mycobacterium sp. 852013-51886_SCH5428379]|uniref:DUF5701 family protein n=1 Tax=Mycobacterium sp. 852013-51886_SCH5428379 TaxID=1834111 RepID=UPI000801C447|nr:DUF5701 family protein [Mycobacterium sp. 852013-51886_SCH5428379]OBB55654.1 hypothetical protein A5757_03955 [Mycobacterium sp. 852013-51886_SCH5428379]